MVYLTRIEKFNAAHKLWVKQWTEEENTSCFGKCSNKNWHGHNYTLHVTVKGHPNPVTGFIMDAKKLKTIIWEKALNQLDHSNLNLDVPFFEESQPTTENLVKVIWECLEPSIVEFNCTLHRILLFETDNIYAEYFGEKR